MTGKVAFAIAVAFILGIALGYQLPRNETEVTVEDPVFKVDLAENEGNLQSSDTLEVRDRRPDPVRTRPSASPQQPRQGRVSPSRSLPGAAFVLTGFDAQGNPSRKWPAAPVGEGLFLVPIGAIQGIRSATISSKAGLSRVIQIRGLDDRGSLAVVEAESRAESWGPMGSLPSMGDQLWVKTCERPRADYKPALARELFVDPGDRMEYRHLEGAIDFSLGGYAFNQDKMWLGFILPMTTGGKPKLLETSAFHLQRLRILELKLADYFRIYHEGSVDVLLAEARHALTLRRFLKAVETFRIVVSRRPEIFDEIRGEFLSAVLGHLVSLPIGTKPRGRFEFLSQAVHDLPNNGDLWRDLAKVALTVGAYEESIRAWVSVWRVAPDQVRDLDAAKNVVYFTWAQSFVDQGQMALALDVIDRALGDTGGSAQILVLQSELLLKQRRYLDAVGAMLDAIADDGSLEPRLRPLIARAERLAAGPGKFVVDYPPGSRSIIVTVRLNNRANGEFVIDTGATTSMVPEELARRAGLDTSDRVPKVKLQTAGNTRIVPYSPVDRLSLGDLSVGGISVVVGNLSGSSGYGLLGMDFLGQFHIENDSQNGRLVLTQR